MNKFLITLFIFFGSILTFAQEVPEKMNFADMELIIEDDAASIIKERIKKLTVNQKFFTGLKAKFQLHAPIISRIFVENNVPEDFKFLCVMESSINPIAVSSSNAVGYWQFKKESGTELGLRIDDLIDERKNIVSSTVAACKYLKRSNALLNNWVYSCQSYNVGLGGTKRSVDNSLFGVKKMKITSQTHEYVVKYLAYVILFREVLNESAPSQTLLEFTNGQNMTLEDIALKADLLVEDIKPFNQWLKTQKIPSDKVYPVIIPVSADKTSAVIEKLKINTFTPEVNIVKQETKTEDNQKSNKKKWWQIFSGKDEDQLNGTDVPVFMTINGISAIQAKPGDNLHKLSNQGNVRYKKFLKYNEMRSFDDLIPGRFYYLAPKKEIASVLFHIVQPNESLWDIAQKYGVTSESIQQKNRMPNGEALALGRKLYMKHPRPLNEAVIIEVVKTQEPIRDTIYKTNTQVIRDTIIKRDTVVKKVILRDSNLENEKPKESNNKSNTESQKEIDRAAVVSKLDSVEYVFHTVEQGQTMYFIHKKYNTPIDSIVKWNQLVDNNLKYGMNLKVSKNKNSKSEILNSNLTTEAYKIHIVAIGETLYGISKKYNVSVSKITEINNLANNALKIGMELKIPK